MNSNKMRGVIKSVPYIKPVIGDTIIDRFNNVATVVSINSGLEKSYYNVAVKCKDGEVREHDEPGITIYPCKLVIEIFDSSYFQLLPDQYQYIMDNNLVGRTVEFTVTLKERVSYAYLFTKEDLPPIENPYTETEVGELVVRGIREFVNNHGNQLRQLKGQDVRQLAKDWWKRNKKNG